MTASDADTYRRQLETAAGFARRLHIDLADGKLAPTKLIDPSEVWWPGNVTADIHAMYKRPFDHLDALLALRPHLIVIHAEAEADIGRFIAAAHGHGVAAGVALLQTTPIEAVAKYIFELDHVLIFSGQLGTFGGHANPALMTKVKSLRGLNQQLEIGWDGGINDQNASALVRAGSTVLNVGGYIQRDDDPAAAYRRLQAAIGQTEAMLDARPPRSRPVPAVPQGRAAAAAVESRRARIGSIIGKFKRAGRK